MFRQMSGGVIPVMTGSMTVGVDWMHPDTRQRLLFSAASSQCVALWHHTGEQYLAGEKANAIVGFFMNVKVCSLFCAGQSLK